MKCQVAQINGYQEVYLSGHVKYEVHMTALDYCLNKTLKSHNYIYEHIQYQNSHILHDSRKSVPVKINAYIH